MRGRALDLERAILDLVENAVRHGPDGEVVVVRSRRTDAALVVEVEDRGPGVAEALRARLVERFFTTEADDRGTGLGLATVRSVAEAHGSRADHDPGWTTGARFVLELPRPASSEP